MRASLATALPGHRSRRKDEFGRRGQGIDDVYAYPVLAHKIPFIYTFSNLVYNGMWSFFGEPPIIPIACSRWVIPGWHLFGWQLCPRELHYLGYSARQDSSDSYTTASFERVRVTVTNCRAALCTYYTYCYLGRIQWSRMGR